jgi:hypothetical protein
LLKIKKITIMNTNNMYNDTKIFITLNDLLRIMDITPVTMYPGAVIITANLTIFLKAARGSFVDC